MKKIIEAQSKVLGLLSGKLEGFYLAGGTALSLFYFQHRESYDLDFFSRDFSRQKVDKIIAVLMGQGFSLQLIGEQAGDKSARMCRYSVPLEGNKALKIDFVEDFCELIKPLKSVNGIEVLSLPDIFFRKILAVCGSVPRLDLTGRTVFSGGRQEVKDVFDLYFLSRTFQPLSDYVLAYCDQLRIESIIVWYRTYDRVALKLGLQDIITDKPVDFAEIERHFKGEIEKIIKRTVD